MGQSICDPLNMNRHKYKLCISGGQVSFYIMCSEDAKVMQITCGKTFYALTDG